MPDGTSFVIVDGADVIRWTLSTGPTIVGTLPQVLESEAVWPTSISSDGNTIIGHIGNNSANPEHGFRWTANEGISILPSASDGTLQRAVPTAVSDNGSVIYGMGVQPSSVWFEPPREVAFRWTSIDGTQLVDGLGIPRAVSSDGMVSVGQAGVGESSVQAVKWTDSTGAIPLGVLENAWQPYIDAGFISSDGNIVVGFGFPPDARIGPKVVRWTSQSGLIPISSRGDDQVPIAISADAEVIVGSMRTLINDAPGFATRNESFVWTADVGLQTLNELLQTFNPNEVEPLLQSDKMHTLIDVSSDGRILFGVSFVYTFEPPLQQQFWLLDITRAPEPSTLLMVTLGAMWLVFDRRRRDNRA